MSPSDVDVMDTIRARSGLRHLSALLLCLADYVGLCVAAFLT